MKAKRFAALLLTASVSLACCACGAGDRPSASDGDRPTIKWLTTGDAAARPIAEDDRILQAIEDKLGINLEVNIVPEGNVDKVNVQMASGDFPDIVTGSWGTSATQQWIDDGIVIPLNDYFDTNEAIKSWCEKDYNWTAFDGKFYGIPFINQYNAANSLIMMRQDWLDKLGLKYPSTLEEMKDVLYAFTDSDPDGNGQNDTYGYTAGKPDSVTGITNFEWVFFANGLTYADYAMDAEGNIIPWFEYEGFIPSMKYIKDLWDHGAIDPEIMMNDGVKSEEKFYQGRAGSVVRPMYRHVSRHENSLHQLFPDASIVYGRPPMGPDGSFGLSKQGKNGMLTCVTSACKNPDKAVAFLNFMISEEGTNLLRLGIEGTHYTKNADGTITYNEEERAKDAFSPNGWSHALTWGSFAWPLEAGYMPDTEPDKDRALESVKLATEAQLPNLMKTKTPTEISSGKALNDIFIQYFSDMLQGKISIEDGSKELSEKWRAQGGDKLLEEVNQLHKAQ